MYYDSTQAGKVYQMTDAPLYNGLTGGYFKSAFGATGSVSRVTLTGYYIVSNLQSRGYLTTNGHYIVLKDGWQYVEAKSVNQYTQTQAQALVNKIIKCNMHILSNNLLCARYADKFTAEQQQQIRDLQKRLQERNDKLTNDGLCTNVQQSYPTGYAELEPYLAQLMANESIGMATWAVITIVAIVIAGMGTAAYYAYKYYAAQAERDVKFSDDLTRILQSKLTDEEYEMLLAETRGIVTKARIKQTLSTGANVWLWAAAGFGVLYLYLKSQKKI